MKGHSIVSKAFSKSKNRSNPGIFLSFAKPITLLISRMFSPMNLPSIKPVWSLFIRSGSTVLMRFAIDFAAIL